MRSIASLIFGLAALIILAQPASASDYMDMDICLGRQVLSRMLCKRPDDVDYVAKVKNDVYLFTVFYANRKVHFFVGVYKNMIRVQGKEYQTATRTIPYHFDNVSKCAVVDYSAPDCPSSERIVCCSEKTVDEKLDEKFWDRPIPELLEEDLRNALAPDNATAPAEPAQGQ